VICVDANVVIRLVEGEPAVRASIEAPLAASRGVRDSVLTSRLTRLECRVKPLRVADTVLLAEYEGFFAGPALVLCEITPAVVEMATDFRATFRVKTPDALHLASAIVSGASAFLTGDRDLARCTEIPVEVL
jgi:predicted nucleic acid-binding protein